MRQDGGSAFPGIEVPGGGYSGMTLRDYFAARVLGPLVSEFPLLLNDDDTRARIAVTSYLMADAMLNAREAK